MRAVLQFYWLDLKDFFRNKLDYSAIAHRLCCLFSGLILAYCLLMCIFCFSGAREDLACTEIWAFLIPLAIF